MRQGLLKNKIKYQLVPLNLHRQNTAKNTIQTFRAHLITCLCASYTLYLFKEWDILLPQATFTLNLIHNCRFNPKLSAHAALHDTFDYNKIPLTPLGTIYLVNEKTTNSCTWAPRGTGGWYIGKYLEHYQCVEYYIPSTHSTRIANTVEFISTFIPIPKTSSEDYLRQSITYIIYLLE